MSKKRIITAILAGALLSASFTGCGEKETKVPEGSQTTFTYWCSMPAAIASAYQNMGEMLMYQELEKRTGIHIQFMHPAVGQEAEQFNLLVASREFPDMVEFDWVNYPGGGEKAVNDNVIIKLNELIEKCAPNFNAAVTQNVDYARQSKTDEGTYFGFPSFNTGQYRIFGGPIIREDWLKELNLEVPKTVEDWETVLRAFKEKKGATAPFTGDFSLFSPLSSVSMFNNAFGIGKGIYLDGDTIKYGPMEDSYKDWIALMHKWYAEGLLDNDYGTQNMSAVDAKMLNGTAGARFGNIGAAIGRYMDAKKGEDSNYSIIAAPYPVDTKGNAAKYAAAGNKVMMPMIAVTTACKDAEGAVKWADYFYSDEGRRLCGFGVEGVTYNMVDGHPVYTDLILKNPDGLSVNEAMTRNFRATAPTPGFNNDEDYLMQYYQFEQQKDGLNTWYPYTEEAKKHIIPLLSPQTDESEELASLQTDISTFVEESVLTFVQGTEPMEKFDAFKQKLKSINVDRYIEIYQNSYNRYLAR